MEEICRAAERAAALTHQLLVFSRQQVLAPEVLDLRRVVSDMHGLLRRTMGEDVRLSVSAGDGSPLPVKADRGQVEQVVLNLVLNSRDAMPTGGSLGISVAEVTAGDGPDGELSPSPAACLTVTDDGCGMEPEVAGTPSSRSSPPSPAARGPGWDWPRCMARSPAWGGASHWTRVRAMAPRSA